LAATAGAGAAAAAAAEQLRGDPRVARVGFAKLQGPGLEHFVTRYETTLGRRNKAAEPDVVVAAPDNKGVSRHHASIVYNFELGCARSPPWPCSRRRCAGVLPPGRRGAPAIAACASGGR
jgi:hypothetical protein